MKPLWCAFCPYLNRFHISGLILLVLTEEVVTFLTVLHCHCANTAGTLQKENSECKYILYCHWWLSHSCALNFFPSPLLKPSPCTLDNANTRDPNDRAIKIKFVFVSFHFVMSAPSPWKLILLQQMLVFFFPYSWLGTGLLRWWGQCSEVRPHKPTKPRYKPPSTFRYGFQVGN